jgi:pimeloyl-ACP methyl ester carboxylesterase
VIRTATLLLVLFLAADPAPAAEDGIAIERDAASGDLTVRIEAPGGRVAWESVARGLARARGYEDGSLAGLLPSGGVRVDGVVGALLRAGLNRALAPSIRFGLTPPKAGKPPVLTIRLGRRAILATKRRFELWLKGVLGRSVSERTEFELSLPEGWEKTPKDRRLVLLVHGLHSGPEDIDSILPDLAKMGLPAGWVRYPNDQSLDASAKLLAAKLAEIRAVRPDRPVALLTHSMGGLVARAVVEDPALDPGNVRQLILVAAPNHGSRLADYAFALEVWEFLGDRTRSAIVSRLFARLEDGLGGAGDDLRPGSPFLVRLNARPRNPRIAYSLLLGTGGSLTAKELVAFRDGVRKAGKTNRFVRFFGSRLEADLADLDEVVRGKGDNAVALKRGRLEGVTDVATFPFRHSVAWDDPDDPGSAAVRRAVLTRLARSLPGD